MLALKWETQWGKKGGKSVPNGLQVGAPVKSKAERHLICQQGGGGKRSGSGSANLEVITS